MTARKDADAAKGDVQEQIDEEDAKGVHGDKVDPVPDEAYTVAGSVAAEQEAKKENK